MQDEPFTRVNDLYRADLSVMGGGATVANHGDLCMEGPLRKKTEIRVRTRISGYGYGARRGGQTPVIEESGSFETPTVARKTIQHTAAVQDWLSAWWLHGILERQADDKFESTLADIDEILLSLDVDALEIPYATVGWAAASAQNGDHS